jgi:hypothetical protein
MTPTETQALLSDLARVKVVFQLRTICAVIGIPAPNPTPLPEAGVTQ